MLELDTLGRRGSLLQKRMLKTHSNTGNVAVIEQSHLGTFFGNLDEEIDHKLRRPTGKEHTFLTGAFTFLEGSDETTAEEGGSSSRTIAFLKRLDKKILET